MKFTFQLSQSSPLPVESRTIEDEESSDFAVHEPVDTEAGVRKRQKIEKPLDANCLIYAQPWYKTIYVTEAAAGLGQLMMEDLVSMHMEYRQFYRPEESSVPQWMKSEEFELLPSALKKMVLGKDGAELGGWMPLSRFQLSSSDL
ncbi:hypothetical protein Dsin_024186 [Dipteronia sinensis]|uniref:Uncharacterized protein n=1 Tax=Dipteronia sinensis TaxID=43782 RepID=A0AAE0E1M0_9ROSI|nr:hypothetical protein Dsin_024186 [Dipteronia sinensis]